MWSKVWIVTTVTVCEGMSRKRTGRDDRNEVRENNLRRLDEYNYMKNYTATGNLLSHRQQRAVKRSPRSRHFGEVKHSLTEYTHKKKSQHAFTIQRRKLMNTLCQSVPQERNKKKGTHHERSVVV
jgi:hypothetical protein